METSLLIECDVVCSQASPKDADFLFNYLDSRVTMLKSTCAESASNYPDASRKNNVSDIASDNTDNDNEDQVKKRAVDATQEETESNHILKSGPDSRDSQDTGGSEESSLGKNSG